MRYVAWMTAAALSLLAGPVTAQEAETPHAVAPRPVVTEIVNLQAGDQVVFPGVIAAKLETDLGFPLIGTVAERPVEAGDLVAKDEVLARLNPEDLDADVRAAGAGVSVAAAQLRSAQDAADRARELAARGVSSDIQVEAADRALTAAKSRLDQARASLARAEDIRGFATLKAPQDGVITDVFAEAGASLSAGQPIVRLAGTQDREIVIDLSERDVAGLRIGDAFRATLAASADIVATATLSRIDPVAERTTRTRRVHLTLDDPPAAFRLGALVRVAPLLGAEAAVSIDRNAVLDRNGAPAVWVVDRATNSVSLRSVELGDSFGSRVRVVRGVAAGDEVVLRGIRSLEDGQIVGPRVDP